MSATPPPPLPDPPNLSIASLFYEIQSEPSVLVFDPGGALHPWLPWELEAQGLFFDFCAQCQTAIENSYFGVCTSDTLLVPKFQS